MRLLASGRDCDVYDAGDGWVLRRYRDGRDAGAEANLLSDLRRAGFPVPAVRSALGPDIVMGRVVGPTLAEAVGSKLVGARAGGQLLAELLRRLHDLTQTSDDPLLHLDLHPGNVLLGEDGPVVVGWCNARRGPAGLDLAVTALVLAQVVVTPGMAATDPVEDAAARLLAPDLLSGFAGSVPGAYLGHLAEAAALRLRDPHQSPVEAARVPDAVALARSVVPSPLVPEPSGETVRG